MPEFDIVDLEPTPPKDDPGAMKLIGYIVAIIVLGCLSAVLIALTIRVVHWIV